jgi:TetR/AcrR family tetracycline transcriptional repressor
MPHPKRTDLPAIVAAAIEVLNERGLDGLSMYAIAARIGVRQPALYHHVGDKEELLAAVAAEVLDRWHTDRLPAEGEPWADFLTRNARSLRRAMLSVRDGARLIAAAGPRSPDLDNAIAQTSLLEAQGFSGPNAVLAFITTARYTIGATLEEQTARDGAAIVLPPGRSDHAAAHLADLARQVNALGPDHEFEVGLTALRHGLARLRDPLEDPTNATPPHAGSRPRATRTG